MSPNITDHIGAECTETTIAGESQGGGQAASLLPGPGWPLQDQCPRVHLLHALSILRVVGVSLDVNKI